jgi:hypothetical protein
MPRGDRYLRLRLAGPVRPRSARRAERPCHCQQCATGTQFAQPRTQRPDNAVSPNDLGLAQAQPRAAGKELISSVVDEPLRTDEAVGRGPLPQEDG